MRRALIISSILLFVAGSAFGQQTSSSASQRVVLQLNPIIVVNVDGINANSANQQLKVSSNSNFIVSSEKAIINQFGYKSLSNGTQDILVSGKRGTDKVFALNNTKTSKNKIANNNPVVSTIYTATEL